jgi:hypothetical protein
MKKYKVFYTELFGEQKEEKAIKTKDIIKYMDRLAEELTEGNHEWWVDDDNLRVYDYYGNEYYFEEIKE